MDVYRNRRIFPSADFMAATATSMEIRRWSLKRDDVLFTKDSESPTDIGVPSHVTENMPDVLCGYHLGRARPNPRFLEGDFLAHALASYAVAKEFSRIANGITRFGLTLPGVRSLPLAVPPLPEQRTIATVLNSIDETIERTKAVITAAEQLRDAMRHELLTRGLPGWHTEWKEIPRLGTIPADWKVVRVGEVAKVNPRRPRLEVKDSTQITFLPMAAIAENCAGILSRPHRAYREISRGYTYFEENDVLFAKITPCLQNGKHALATGLTRGFGFGTTEFHVIRAGSLIKPTHLFHVLTRPINIDRCKNQFRGTAGQQRVHPETLRSLPIPLPPLLEQRAIATVLASIDNAIETSQRRKDALNQLKESTAEALLTGQRRVPLGAGESR